MRDHLETVYGQTITKKEHAVILVVVNTLLAFSNILINVFVVYAIWKLKLQNTISYRFIIGLNISDACIGLLLQPAFSVILLKKYQKLEMFCQFISFSFCQFSGVMTMIITLDRYIHMKYLQSYNLHMTSKRATLLIAGNIVLSLGLAICYTFSTIFGFFFYLHITFIAVDFLVVIISFLLYTRTYISIKSRIDGLQLDANIGMKDRTKKRQRPDMEFAKGMIFICILLAICYMPYFVIGLIVSYKEKFSGKVPDEDWIIARYWSYILVYVIGFGNATLLIAFNKRLKRFTSNWLPKGRPQENNSILMENTTKTAKSTHYEADCNTATF